MLKLYLWLFPIYFNNEIVIKESKEEGSRGPIWIFSTVFIILLKIFLSICLKTCKNIIHEDKQNLSNTDIFWFILFIIIIQFSFVCEFPISNDLFFSVLVYSLD